MTQAEKELDKAIRQYLKERIAAAGHSHEDHVLDCVLVFCKAAALDDLQRYIARKESAGAAFVYGGTNGR